MREFRRVIEFFEQQLDRRAALKHGTVEDALIRVREPGKPEQFDPGTGSWQLCHYVDWTRSRDLTREEAAEMAGGQENLDKPREGDSVSEQLRAVDLIEKTLFEGDLVAILKDREAVRSISEELGNIARPDVTWMMNRSSLHGINTGYNGVDGVFKAWLGQTERYERYTRVRAEDSDVVLRSGYDTWREHDNWVTTEMLFRGEPARQPSRSGIRAAIRTFTREGGGDEEIYESADTTWYFRDGKLTSGEFRFTPDSGTL